MSRSHSPEMRMKSDFIFCKSCGLLGIDLEQIRQDFIVYAFTSICNDSSPSVFYTNLENLLDYYSSYIGNDSVDNGTIYDRAVEYCNDIGLTNSEINTIRANLLEDVIDE